MKKIFIQFQILLLKIGAAFLSIFNKKK